MPNDTIPLPNLPHWAFADKHDLVPSEVRTDIKRYGESYAAAVSAAKDAEIAGLQIKADLFDLAVRKGLLSVHSELMDPRNHGTRCSWLEGHAKACDISNAARAALGDKNAAPPSA